MDPRSVIRDLRLRLEADRVLGLNRRLSVVVPAPDEASVSSVAAPDGRSVAPERASGEPLATAKDTVPEDVDRPESVNSERDLRQSRLDEIAAQVRVCEECPLCESRTQTVFGVGDPAARLLFVGEGPGFDEDRLGEPFVGRAGQLLDRMILAMGLSRPEVYIANVVKCRPPQNRTPNPRETISCLSYLGSQIDVIAPEVIVTLGNTPTRTLLDTLAPISRLRGSWQSFRDIPLLPTFHPAYLLRNSGDKRLVWQDLQQVMARLGLQAPKL